MKRKKTLLLFIIFPIFLFGQNVQRFNNNWVFGVGVKMNFSFVPALTSTNNILMSSPEGVASISDGFGNLLFYSGSQSPSTAITLYGTDSNPIPNVFSIYWVMKVLLKELLFSVTQKTNMNIMFFMSEVFQGLFRIRRKIYPYK